MPFRISRNACVVGPFDLFGKIAEVFDVADEELFVEEDYASAAGEGLAREAERLGAVGVNGAGDGFLLDDGDPDGHGSASSGRMFQRRRTL